MSTSTAETISRIKPEYVFIIVGSLVDESIKDLQSSLVAANHSMQLIGGEFISLNQLIQSGEKLTSHVIDSIKRNNIPVIILGHAAPHTLGDLPANTLSSQLINVGLPQHIKKIIQLHVIGCSLVGQKPDNSRQVYAAELITCLQEKDVSCIIHTFDPNQVSWGEEANTCWFITELEHSIDAQGALCWEMRGVPYDMPKILEFKLLRHQSTQLQQLQQRTKNEFEQIKGTIETLLAESISLETQITTLTVRVSSTEPTSSFSFIDVSQRKTMEAELCELQKRQEQVSSDLLAETQKQEPVAQKFHQITREVDGIEQRIKIISSSFGPPQRDPGLITNVTCSYQPAVVERDPLRIPLLSEYHNPYPDVKISSKPTATRSGLENETGSYIPPRFT